MIRSAVLVAGIVAAVTPALRADDQTLLDSVLLTRVRSMAAKTTLVENGAARASIVAPVGGPWSSAARRLQAGIETVTGTQLPIVPDTDFATEDWTNGNSIVMGNLLVSSAYARLYHNFFVCADAGYTGSAGFELRTAHEPFGPGGNVVALGAQTEKGLSHGIDRLLEIVRKHAREGELVLPRLLELDLKRAGAREPTPQKLSASAIAAGKASYDQVYARVGTERSAAHRVVRDAMLYHRTGDEGYLELYRYGMKSHIDYYRESDYINREGLGRYDRDFRDSWTWKFVVTWDFLEEHPDWSEEERLLITNHVLRCVLECNVYQNWMSRKSVDAWRDFSSITHNHHTWPGLANLFGGWYFKRHYRHPLADDWLSIAHGMFRGCRHSSKPWEDSAGYQWIPLRHVLTYSFATGDMTFVNEGHAELAGQTVLMCMDSLGHQPAFGDHSSFTASSGMREILSQLEYACRDGRYSWALDRLNAESGGELEEAYYTDVEPRQPDDLVGLTASYLPRPHYELNGRNKQYFPRANVSFEESFDKITLRAGWNPNDDYLMLDGYSGGSHGHQDCNAIIGYTAAGAHWLVDGEYIRQTPKYHCAVTVVRDGVSVRNPAMARLDDAVGYCDDTAICRATIPDYNGVGWTRNIFWHPNRFTAVIDELTAVKPGDYTLTCCWRVYGESTLDGNQLTLRQGDARFTLQNLSADRMELVPIKDVANLPVQHLYQCRSCTLDRGERVCFVNVFDAVSGDEPPFIAALCGEGRAAIHTADDTWIAGVGPFDSQGWSINAQAWLADDRGIRLVSATDCAKDKREVWHSDKPSAIHIAADVIRTATPRTTPHDGQRPVLDVRSLSTDKIDIPLALDIRELSFPVSPQPLTNATALTNAKPLPMSWRFDDFPRTPKTLRIAGVQTTPEPRESYRPVERIFDGHYSSSTGSCLFPAGETVTIDLELEQAHTVTEVRIRAWEMSDSWNTNSRKLYVSPDGQTWTTVPGDLKMVGTQQWGGNINTIYGQTVDREVRFLRIVAKPASESCSVYFAEIEVMGTEAGEPPALTAITEVDLDGDGVEETVIGTGGGHIVTIDSAGRERWRVDVGAPITALTGGDLTGNSQAVVYGAAPDRLGSLAPDGRKVREIRIPQYRGVPSEPQNITVADLDGDGVASIVVGVRSWQYLAYTPQLQLQWNNVIYAHSATVAEVADLDGDGTKETVGGNAYFRLNIIDSGGKRRVCAGRFGPEQSAVTSADVDGNGRREVVLGTDGGNVLVFDLDGNQQWQRNVGGRVTSLASSVIGGQSAIVAASESGYVWAFDVGGEPLWYTNLGEPVRRLVSSGGRFVCAASSAGVVVLSPTGAVLAVAATPAAAVDIVVDDGRCVAQLADGSVCGVALEP